MEKWKSYLEQPERVDRSAVPFLQQIQRRYPWFGPARILLYKASEREDPLLNFLLMDRSRPDMLLTKPAYIEHGSSEMPPSQKPQQRDTLGVIDRFLSLDDWRIVPVPNLSEEDISVDSLRDDTEIVTEELAQIYLNQGLNEKARDIYCRLSLLFPEKSAYFAEIIAQIERKIDVEKKL